VPLSAEMNLDFRCERKTSTCLIAADAGQARSWN